MSVQSDSLLTTIETAAAGPYSVSGDAGSFTSQPLSEMIAAHRYIAGTDPTVSSSPARGLRFTRLNPPGACQGRTGWRRFLR